MSAEEIQARIAQVSADIERQKEVLQKLERSKCALQRQLNDVRDPVARLPPEISSEIFTLCLPSRPQPGAGHVPMLLLNICTAWTEIAIANPALWATIHIEIPRTEGFSAVLGAWLKRARNHPLHISLGRTLDDAVANVIQPYTENLKGLQIFADDGNGLVLPTRIAPFPSLETFTLGSLPDVDGQYSGYTHSQIMEFLRHTPNLVECTFINIFMYNVLAFPLGLVLPSLRHLKLGRVKHKEDFRDDTIIKHLSLPALDTLHLPITDITQFDLFLRRSSPPLRKLAVALYSQTTLQFQRQLVASL